MSSRRSGLCALAATAALHSHAAAADVGWREHVASPLLSIYDAALNPRPEQPQAQGAAILNAVGIDHRSMRIDTDGRVQIDVWYDCSRAAPVSALAADGLAIAEAVHLGTFCVVEGWVSPTGLAALAAVETVERIDLPTYATPHPPRQVPLSGAHINAQLRRAQAQSASDNGIDLNGVVIMHADQFAAQSHVTGAGVTVGVQSAGIASLALIESRGELPAVKVVDPAGGASNSGGDDEGTILMEEVHAVAPGATLAYCGPATFVQYTSCLNQLIAAGATILADDVAFPASELLSSDSPQAQAVNQILTAHPTVMLFTAAGNYNGSYWEGTYTPVSASSLGIAPLSCNAVSPAQSDQYATTFGGKTLQQLTVSQAGSFPVNLTWSDPPGKNVSQFDLYWFDASSGVQRGCLSGSSASSSQIAQNVAFQSGSYRLVIATPDTSAAGKFIKLWIGGDGLTMISVASAGSVVTPQAYASGAISVGAVNGSDGIGNHIEAFSSVGPVTVKYPSAAQFQAPTLVAPDGISVDAAGTNFAPYLFPDGNFYGTSASSPNAAAVAALIRAAFPQFNPTQVLSALQKGAAQLGSTVPDPAFGYGRVDAQGALSTIPGPTMSSLPDATLNAASSSPAYPFSVTGTGTLHFSVTSSNTSLIPGALVNSGSPGVTVTPSTCGSSTLSCSLVVTTAHGPSSTVKLTVAAVDGGGRSAPATMTVTVNGDQQSAPSSPPATSGGGGGSLAPWELVALLLMISSGGQVRLRSRAR
ncbi:MAG: S8 family serine peptidase [Sinobacteraceae bacterium]|nr:S8 family serine peptidase [Nevskiaceae bacterium]